LLLAYFINGAVLEPFFSNVGFLRAIDVSRRVTAPDWSMTALLTREYHFDANLRLWIVDDPYADVPEEVAQALWTSRDYMPDPQENWHEDMEWSKDSSIIAVTMNGQYVFAYDFDTDQRLEDAGHIPSLMESRDDLQD